MYAPTLGEYEALIRYNRIAKRVIAAYRIGIYGVVTGKRAPHFISLGICRVLAVCLGRVLGVFNDVGLLPNGYNGF